MFKMTHTHTLPLTNKQDLRKALRREYRDKRASLSQAKQQEAEQQLVLQAQRNGLLTDVRQVALYFSNDGEISTNALIQEYWRRNVKVYLPVIHPFNPNNLLFLRYAPTTALVANRFGILEPKLNVTQVIPAQHLDIIFTPLVAFDQKGNRLGMGGGFYDRTFAALHASTVIQSQIIDGCKASTQESEIKIIGLAHDIQKAVSLPHKAWDVPLPFILTPEQYYRF